MPIESEIVVLLYQLHDPMSVYFRMWEARQNFDTFFLGGGGGGYREGKKKTLKNRKKKGKAQA